MEQTAAGVTIQQNLAEPNIGGHWILIHWYGGTEHVHDMNITSQDLQGTLVGEGGHPAGRLHAAAWRIVTGVVAQQKVSLKTEYTVGTPGTIMHMTGDVTHQGTRIENGTWDDNYLGQPRKGTWIAFKLQWVP